MLDVLRDLKGSGTPAEVADAIALKLGLPADVVDAQTPGGQSRYANQVAWARFYLAKAGMIDAPRRGLWALTKRGWKTRLDTAGAQKIAKAVQQGLQLDDAASAHLLEEPTTTMPSTSADEPIPAEGYRTQLRARLHAMSPGGFERFCVFLLRAAGFQHVNVTGRSGDQGIDGNGILELSPFVTYRVLFQCKRYRAAVAPASVREFRGAMEGRVADRGLFITTSTFTREARNEAAREGTRLIELVDGDKLIDIMRDKAVGLGQPTHYEIDGPFFDQFTLA